MAGLPLQLELYTAPGCCLCEELKRQLKSLRSEITFQVREVDITADPELERKFRQEIPVLLVNGRRAAKYRISTDALRQRLRTAAGGGVWRILGLLRFR